MKILHHVFIKPFNTFFKNFCTININHKKGTFLNHLTSKESFHGLNGILQECMNSKDLPLGKLIHSIMIRTGMISNGFLQHKLLTMYAKCLVLDYAQQLFDKIPKPQISAWNSMISAYGRFGRIEDAENIFYQMGTNRDIISWNTMITNYVLCAQFDKARQVFDKMPEKNSVSWNSLIAGYAKKKDLQEAFMLFTEMKFLGFSPTPQTVTSILGLCADAGDIIGGRTLHADIVKVGFRDNIFVDSSLVNLYGKCEMLEDLDRVLEEMQGHCQNVAACNAAISGYAKHGRLDCAYDFFRNMTHKNVVTWTAMLSGFIHNGKMEDASRIFDAMPVRNVVSWSAMISGYVKLGVSGKAFELFFTMLRSGMRPNESTFSSIVSACVGLGFLEHGAQFHACIVKMGFGDDDFVQSSLIDMYSKCMDEEELDICLSKSPSGDFVLCNLMVVGCAKNGRVVDARNLFDKLPNRDVVSWNSLLSSYCENGGAEEGYELFLKMPTRTLEGWTEIILGFAKNGKLKEAYRLFEQMPNKDVVAWTAMIYAFLQNSQIEKARELFDLMPERNIVSWDVMIAGYARKGMAEEALWLFNRMPEKSSVSLSEVVSSYFHIDQMEAALKCYFSLLQSSMRPSLSLLCIVVKACTCMGATQQGRKAHGHVIKFGYATNSSVLTSLIIMYTKCGCLESATQVFNQMEEKNLLSWHEIIQGHALHGFGEEALESFEQMLASGVKPDDIVFLAVLSACSHAGLVDRGWYYFELMRKEYGILPRPFHYSCMVDLLGRSGQLEEAMTFVNKICAEQDVAV